MIQRFSEFREVSGKRTFRHREGVLKGGSTFNAALRVLTYHNLTNGAGKRIKVFGAWEED